MGVTSVQRGCGHIIWGHLTVSYSTIIVFLLCKTTFFQLRNVKLLKVNKNVFSDSPFYSESILNITLQGNYDTAMSVCLFTCVNVLCTNMNVCMCVCESYLGSMRRIFPGCSSLLQLCTVAVLMCGTTSARSTSSEGKTISMLKLLPWYGSSITMYFRPWGVLARPIREGGQTKGQGSLVKFRLKA